MGGLTIAVTGAAGMLGSHLVARLAADGHDVVGVDLRDDPHPPAGARHIVADIRDAAALARAFDGAHALVHCAAALPSYPVDQIRSITVDGTRTVLTAAHRARVERVVHISSTAVYGLPQRVPTPEEHPREPVDPYSRAKAEAEEVCEEFRARGMCLPVLRPKTFLGPGRMGLFSMLFEWAEERRNFPVLGRGDVRIQMFGMADLVDAVVLALNAPPETANDVYNLGAAEFGTLREDFQAVLDAAGHGKRVVPLPAAPALAFLRLLERTKLSPVYGRLLFKLLDDSYVDIGRATERLGFRPALSNRDAILGTYAWWRTQRGPHTRSRSRPDQPGPVAPRGARPGQGLLLIPWSPAVDITRSSPAPVRVVAVPPEPEPEPADLTALPEPIAVEPLQTLPATTTTATTATTSAITPTATTTTTDVPGRRRRNRPRDLLALLRPGQWVKNLAVVPLALLDTHPWGPPPSCAPAGPSSASPWPPRSSTSSTTSPTGSGTGCTRSNATARSPPAGSPPSRPSS